MRNGLLYMKKFANECIACVGVIERYTCILFIRSYLVHVSLYVWVCVQLYLSPRCTASHNVCIHSTGCDSMKPNRIQMNEMELKRPGMPCHAMPRYRIYCN